MYEMHLALFLKAGCYIRPQQSTLYMDKKVKLYYKVWTNIYNILFSSQLQSFAKIMQKDPKLFTATKKASVQQPSEHGSAPPSCRKMMA
jgi:hypothetical protein